MPPKQLYVITAKIKNDTHLVYLVELYLIKRRLVKFSLNKKISPEGKSRGIIKGIV